MPCIAVGTGNSAPIEIYYEDHGSGEPVVLIHRYPLNGNSWERQERALLGSRRVIRYDRRGFGRSSRRPSGTTTRRFTADLHALMEHLDLTDAVRSNVDVLPGSRISDRAWQASFNVAAGASPFATYACVDSWLTDFRADVAKIDVPVLVVHGTDDRILPFDATAARLPALIAECTLVPVEGGPHNIGWTHPEDVNGGLVEFISAKVT